MLSMKDQCNFKNFSNFEFNNFMKSLFYYFVNYRAQPKLKLASKKISTSNSKYAEIISKKIEKNTFLTSTDQKDIGGSVYLNMDGNTTAKSQKSRIKYAPVVKTAKSPYANMSIGLTNKDVGNLSIEIEDGFRKEPSFFQNIDDKFNENPSMHIIEHQESQETLQGLKSNNQRSR